MSAWIATKPVVNRNAPLTPFAMPQYRLAAAAEADRLDVEAEASAAAARLDIQRASNYILGVVLCAVSLFFLGISTKLVGVRARVFTLATGWAVFLGTLIWIATFPVSVAV